MLKIDPIERDEWLQVYASMRAALSANGYLSVQERRSQAAEEADEAIKLLRERLGTK